MPTDTSEKGLETRICNLAPGVGLAPRGEPGLPCRVLRGPGPPARLPSGYPARDRPSTPSGLRRQHPPPVPPTSPQTGPGPGHYRRAPERNRPWRPQHPPLLRHPLTGERVSRNPQHPEPLLRDPAGPLQHQEPTILPGPRAVHQRPPHPDLRAQEQSHQAEGR